MQSRRQVSNNGAFRRITNWKESVESVKTGLNRSGDPKDEQPMHSWGSCRCRYRREAVHFSVKNFVSGLREPSSPCGRTVLYLQKAQVSQCGVE